MKPLIKLKKFDEEGNVIEEEEDNEEDKEPILPLEIEEFFIMPEDENSNISDEFKNFKDYIYKDWISYLNTLSYYQ